MNTDQNKIESGYGPGLIADWLLCCGWYNLGAVEKITSVAGKIDALFQTCGIHDKHVTVTSLLLCYCMQNLSTLATAKCQLN